VPRSVSAKKRQHLTEKKTARNLALKSQMKSAIKKTERAVATKVEDAPAKVQETSRLIDKMVSKGIIHKNQAARRKSRLVKKAAKPV
jgi:small subunit ribosomal protein S20